MTIIEQAQKIRQDMNTVTATLTDEEDGYKLKGTG